MKNQTKIYSFIKVLSSIGILLTVYLLWQQFFRPAFQPCYVNSFINCDAVISGPVAKTLGIPTPLYGLIGYLVILYAAFTKKSKLMLYMAGFGLAFCLRLAYIELFQLKVICPICIMCQLTMVSIFSLALIVNKKTSNTVSK
ncbi:hypothetical protein A3E10_01125 [Candidatus Roizmanbacteria bacterium RIFCSPHIGHO2_12_FULL_37_23]|nr:MAG: hypothetical protein A3E10_01125 [Candidatus Roizmanbacteria bacterium RIFCSPHIGHO2_12_FULL_37_23]